MGLTKTQLLYGPGQAKPEGVVSTYLPRVQPDRPPPGAPLQTDGNLATERR